MSKPRIAIFDFACCEGCQLQIVNLEESLLDLVGQVDVVTWREAVEGESDEYDVALVEGSCVRKSDEPRLKQIRERAKILVALGACACTGCVNNLVNFRGVEQAKQEVYGDKADLIEAYGAHKIDDIVPVDAYVHGCPINRAEFLRIVTDLLLGKKIEIANYPVCVECKMAGNECRFEKGGFCLGPITRAGCGAICPTNNSDCAGCRGLVDDPNANAENEVLEKYGLTVEDMTKKYRVFLGATEVAT